MAKTNKQTSKQASKQTNSSSFLLLVAMPFAPSSFLLLVVRPGAPSSFLLLVAKQAQDTTVSQNPLGSQGVPSNHPPRTFQHHSLRHQQDTWTAGVDRSHLRLEETQQASKICSSKHPSMYIYCNNTHIY